MRIIFLLFCGVNSFLLKPILKPKLRLYTKPPVIHENKLLNYLELIRYKNILPTIFLNFSGGWLMNPSIDILSSTPFLISIISTIFIMSISMILNDIYDIDIDKINNPQRPLVTGKITISEAKLLIYILLGLTEFLTINYLDKNLELIVLLAIGNIIIYTPILKKITFIKNISCAGIISFAPIISGLTTIVDNDYSLLLILTGITFLGSLYSEILLDIRDYEGDKKNNINTIPVLFGNETSYYLAVSILCINIIFSLLSLTLLYDFNHGIVLPILSLPMLIDLDKVKQNNYSSEIINEVSTNTYIYLFNSLIYLCLIKSS